jgi:uncharacterized membrane protein
MAVFHFSFDLSHAGLISANFYEDPLWTTQRTLILSLFLVCAGAGQAVAAHQGQIWARFWRRWAHVFACAMLVSAGSYLMFPHSFIYFGVLHGMAAMLIVARLTAAWGQWLWLLGLLALLAPQLLGHPDFNPPLWNWTGLITQKPITQDYVPILPWMGVMWWALAATQWVLRHRPALLASPTSTTSWPWRTLVLLGRWSLTFYMLHQPLLLGAVQLYLHLAGTPA